MPRKLRQTLNDNRIEAVIHMAASSLVGESCEEPAKYYHNNVVAGLVLLDAMHACEVKKIVFSSTAATYGEPEKQPILETDPTNPTNPYGETKLAFERAHALVRTRLTDSDMPRYGISMQPARLRNAVRITIPRAHLIPITLQAAAGKRTHVEIYGDDYPTPDGTCIRDYIHVVDLARAHILALDVLSGTQCDLQPWLRWRWLQCA